MTKNTKKTTVIFKCDGKRYTVTGQVAHTILALKDAGSKGITSLEVSKTWALRLAAYIHILRHRHGLSIVTSREPHNGAAGKGYHGRYTLKSFVTVLKVDKK